MLTGNWSAVHLPGQVVNHGLGGRGYEIGLHALPLYKSANIISKGSDVTRLMSSRDTTGHDKRLITSN